MSSSGLSVGIVGLPNVGKSTLFNALRKAQGKLSSLAMVGNYPFTTIEPNVGVVPVPDERLEVLADIVAFESLGHLSSVDSSHPRGVPQAQHHLGGEKSKRPPVVPATVKFVDIAGLVKGAAEGEGLGNKFLSHIREASVIAHVVRDFGDVGVIREGSVDPKSDYQTIQTELILADLESISKLKSQSAKLQLKTQDETIEKIYQALNKGIPVRNLEFAKEEREFVDQLFLLSAKPEIIVLNVSEEDYSEEKMTEIIERYKDILNSVIASEAKQSQDSEQARMTKRIASSQAPRNDGNNNMVVISAKIESELSELSENEQKEYLSDLGLKESGLERLIQKAYETLGLISFLTAGEKEVRAWTLRAGWTALRASGVIHTDFEKNFIKAEVIPFNDFVQYNGWKGAREKGKTRMEGKNYIMRDGDVVEFKIGK